MTTPQATSAAPVAPTSAAPTAAPLPTITQAAPTSGAAQPVAAPAAKRSRVPHGPLPPAVTPSTGTIGVPALLELAAATPMYTDQRRQVNYLVPDANTLFHVSGTSDNMMNTTHRFLQNAPAWLPIVTQLYVSILWHYQVLTVYVNSGYGLSFADLHRNLTDILRLDELLIPGPLVPFFSALAAVNGPFDWIGDITSAMPHFSALWDATTATPHASYLRSVPIPAVLLDQLYYWSQYANTTASPVYTNFEWFRNVFGHPLSTNTNNKNIKLSPTLSGSLYTTKSQNDASYDFWNAVLSGFTRFTIATHTHTSYEQLLGFASPTMSLQIDWFQHVSIVMQKYCLHFNGSLPLKAISPVGIGATLVYAKPAANTATRNWLYPATLPGSFKSNKFDPAHPMPSALSLTFNHADHEAEEIAEQYAILTSTNIMWSENNGTQNGFTAISRAATHDGTYWDAPAHRRVHQINLLQQFGQIDRKSVV